MASPKTKRRQSTVSPAVLANRVWPCVCRGSCVGRASNATEVDRWCRATSSGICLLFGLLGGVRRRKTSRCRTPLPTTSQPRFYTTFPQKFSCRAPARLDTSCTNPFLATWLSRVRACDPCTPGHRLIPQQPNIRVPTW